MVNHFILQGFLIDDPQIKKTKTGINVCNFRVAWSQHYRKQYEQLYMKCVVWRKTAEVVANSFQKGSPIAIEGSLSTHIWKNKNGDKRYEVLMNVKTVHFCTNKTGNIVSGFTEIIEDNDEYMDMNGFWSEDDGGELPY